MPPKVKKSTLIILANVGSSSLDQNSLDDEPFIDKVKYAMKILIEKKIFLQPKDEIGIITMGDDTDNPDNVDNVKLYCEHLLVPNWEMVKYVKNLTAKNHSCNWVEALHVALCFMNREVMDPENRVFLVIFNNFKEDADSIDSYDSDVIIDELKNFQNLFTLFVGENSLSKDVPSENFALSIMEGSGAQYELIDNFVETRQFYIAPSINAIPWKINLNWAGLYIPCSTFVKISESVKMNPWKIQAIVGTQNSLGDITEANTKNIVRENIQMDFHRNEIKPENIINGYKFGGKYIPFSDEDELAMKYCDSKKSLIIFGFVPQSEVKLEYWAGKGSRIIVPESEENAEAFYSLVKAMADKQYAAIVRKVYSNNNLPRMGVLFPKIEEDEIWCLTHLELPFVNDIRVFQKKPIKSADKEGNKEKIEALNNFIDSMTIENDELPYLNPGMFPNIRNQYNWNAIAERAVDSDKPLISLNSYLEKYLEPPQVLKNKSELFRNKLNMLYSLSKTNNVNSRNENNTDINHVVDSKSDIPNISHNQSKNPEEKLFSPDDIDLKMEELEDM